MAEPTPDLAAIVAEAEHYGYVIRAIDHYEGPTGDDLLPAVRAALEQRVELEGVLGEYGDHADHCRMVTNRESCNCGWNEARDALLARSAAAKEGASVDKKLRKRTQEEGLRSIRIQAQWAAWRNFLQAAPADLEQIQKWIEQFGQRFDQTTRERDEARQQAERAEKLWEPTRQLEAAWATYIESGSDEDYAAFELAWGPVGAALAADSEKEGGERGN